MRGCVLVLLALAGPAAAEPHRYDLPEETAAFAPGPNLEVVQQYCSGCHSADYVSTQPRRLRDPAAFWQAEVAKMRAAYGAPIDAEAVPRIVEYLVGTYGQ